MASREQYYGYLFCTRSRQKSSVLKWLPPLCMQPPRTLQNTGLFPAFNSQHNEAQLLLLWWPIFHIWAPLWIYAASFLSELTVGLLSYWYRCARRFTNLRKQEIDLEWRMGTGLRWRPSVVDLQRFVCGSVGVWVGGLSGGARACSKTFEMGHHHLQPKLLCKDERINCWGRKVEHNGQMKKMH